MSSVTQRIRSIKQPYGGYLKPSEFEVIQMEDNLELKGENIHSSLVGLAVDYLTWFMLNESAKNAFKISRLGAKRVHEQKYADKLIDNIKGLDSISIISACKLVGYDTCYRSSISSYTDVDNINPDNNTIENIVIMVNRSLNFFKEYGPIVKDGFTLEGGYTNIINAGDGDFITKDILWDFKVSRNKPTSQHTLQLLVYYIMGMHSIHTEFKDIERLGIYNPRTNTIYLKSIKDISKEILEEVSTEVIGYSIDNNYKKKYINYKNDDIKRNDNILSMKEIMEVLKCTRYTVMKYFEYKNLPLFKKKNKYYIYESDFQEWMERMEEEKKQAIVIYVVVIIILLLITCAIMKSLF